MESRLKVTLLYGKRSINSTFYVDKPNKVEEELGWENRKNLKFALASKIKLSKSEKNMKFGWESEIWVKLKEKTFMIIKLKNMKLE